MADGQGTKEEEQPLLAKAPKERNCEFASLCGQREDLDAYSATNHPDDQRKQFTGQQANRPESSDLGEGRGPTPKGYKAVVVKDKDVVFEKDKKDQGPLLAHIQDLEGVPHAKGAVGDGGNNLYSTDMKVGLTEEEAQKRIELFGYNELPEKPKNICLQLCLEFVTPMALIVWVAIILELVEAIIEFGNGNSGPAHSDLVDVFCLLALQFLNVFVGFFEEMKAEAAIEALKKQLLPEATVLRDGIWKVVAAREVVIGDICKLVHGKAVAADGRILPTGQRVEADESQLTGESLPKTIRANEECLMGSIVKTGESEMMIEYTGKYTFFGKTAALLERKEDVGHFEQLLQALLWVLVVLGVVVNLIIVLFLSLQSHPPPVLDVISFAVVLLIASIPIALRVVCVTTLALGARSLSVEGAIVSKMSAIEEIASMTLLCSDKTGTLTMNKMELVDPSKQEKDDPKIFIKQGTSFDELMQHAALAAIWWKPPSDALDTLVLGQVCRYKYLSQALLELYESDEDLYAPFDPSRKRTQAKIVPKSKESSLRVELPEAMFLNPDTEKYDIKDQLSIDGETSIPITNYHQLGTEAGRPFRVTKGAPQVIFDMIAEPEKSRIKEDYDLSVRDLAKRGIRSLAIAISYEDVDKDKVAGGGWTMLGLLAFKDPERPDSKITIELLRDLGVETKMVTGDQALIAEETSKKLNLPHKDILFIKKNDDGSTEPLPTFADAKELREMAENIKECPLGEEYGLFCDKADGFAQVYPEHKYLIVAALQQYHHRHKGGEPVGMTGDGVNDAPALHRANIGIAVEGSTDAARGAADIVLTEPGLSAVVTSVMVSRKIFQRMKNFVVYRIACTLQLLIFFLIACLVYDPKKQFCGSSEFFYLPVAALVTIVILNDGTIISVAFDNVESSKAPAQWNMFALSIISCVVGGVALVSSLIILQWGLSCSLNHMLTLPDNAVQLGIVKAGTLTGSACRALHHHQDNFLQSTGLASTFGMDKLDYEGIKTMIYLKIALSDYLSLFNSRCTWFFFSRMPSWHVITAAVFSTICSSMLAHWWPFGSDMKPIDWGVVGFVWIFTLIFGLIQDLCKVFAYLILGAFGEVDLNAQSMDEKHIKGLQKEGRDASHAAADKYKRENKKVRYLDEEYKDEETTKETTKD